MQLGIEVKRKWICKGYHSRPTHRMLHGQIVSADEPFITATGISLMFPGDPNAPAEEIINCHCVLVPVVVGRKAKKHTESRDAYRETISKTSTFTKPANRDIITWGKALFRTDELLNTHFIKHQAEFAGISMNDYLAGARNLLNADESTDVRRLKRSDDSISKYRVSTNEFVVGNADGTIRTYFKPKNGAAYWNEEIERNK